MGKRKRESKDLNPDKVDFGGNVKKDDTLSKGGVVKANGDVLKALSLSICRPPNMSCRIQSFGRICQKFDERRTRWVTEMGFGGLLHFVSDMHLPRQLAYWVMSRIDPMNKCLIAPDGRVFWFSKNQVRWILGIPVTSQMMDRLEGHFDIEDEEEFKSIFLIVSLHMVLCPTQSSRLASDLLPALSCVMDCVEYDWCEMVLNKLMDSVASFARHFYANGFAGGCGGCSMFAIIFYLDRLDRDSVAWNAFPRIKVWSMKQIGMTSKEDRLQSGDYGKLGLLDVAYEERHSRQARDTEGPSGNIVHNDVSNLIVSSKDGRRSEIGASQWNTKTKH